MLAAVVALFGFGYAPLVWLPIVFAWCARRPPSRPSATARPPAVHAARSGEHAGVRFVVRVRVSVRAPRRLNAIDETCVTLLLPTWQHDVKSAVHAARLRRELL